MEAGSAWRGRDLLACMLLTGGGSLAPNSGSMAADSARFQSRLDLLLDNPILRYEAVPKFLRRRRVLVRGFALVVGLLASAGCGLLLMIVSAPLFGVLGLVLATLWSLVTILAPAAQASRTIARERQRGSWEALLMSHLRPADIILGKLLSALLPFWIAGLLLAPLLIITWQAGPWARIGETGELLARYLSTLALSASFASIALWFSLQSKTESSAQLLTLLTMAVCYFLSSFVVAILAFGLIGDAGSREFMTPALLRLLQLAVLIAPGALALLDLLLRFGALERRGRK